MINKLYVAVSDNYKYFSMINIIRLSIIEFVIYCALNLSGSCCVSYYVHNTSYLVLSVGCLQTRDVIESILNHNAKVYGNFVAAIHIVLIFTDCYK